LTECAKLAQATGEPDREEPGHNETRPQQPPRGRQPGRINLTAKPTLYKTHRRRKRAAAGRPTNSRSAERTYIIPTPGGKYLGKTQRPPVGRPSRDPRSRTALPNQGATTLRVEIALVNAGAPAATQARDARHRMTHDAEGVG
ncbi:Hypothetical predicted protein, partial [Pelobates cultripes]